MTVSATENSATGFCRGKYGGESYYSGVRTFVTTSLRLGYHLRTVLNAGDPIAPCVATAGLRLISESPVTARAQHFFLFFFFTARSSFLLGTENK